MRNCVQTLSNCFLNETKKQLILCSSNLLLMYFNLRPRSDALSYDTPFGKLAIGRTLSACNLDKRDLASKWYLLRPIETNLTEKLKSVEIGPKAQDRLFLSFVEKKVVKCLNLQIVKCHGLVSENMLVHFSPKNGTLHSISGITLSILNLVEFSVRRKLRLEQAHLMDPWNNYLLENTVV